MMTCRCHVYDQQDCGHILHFNHLVVTSSYGSVDEPTDADEVPVPRGVQQLRDQDRRHIFYLNTILLLPLLIIQAISRLMLMKCRCHGVSGSCEFKTCWRSLPPFAEIGNYLKRKYDKSAVKVIRLRLTGSMFRLTGSRLRLIGSRFRSIGSSLD